MWDLNLFRIFFEKPKINLQIPLNSVFGDKIIRRKISKTKKIIFFEAKLAIFESGIFMAFPD